MSEKNTTMVGATLVGHIKIGKNFRMDILSHGVIWQPDMTKLTADPNVWVAIYSEEGELLYSGINLKKNMGKGTSLRSTKKPRKSPKTSLTKKK